MAQRGQRKCWCCAEYFDVDYRNRERQRYCVNTACRRASKVASQAAWLGKAQNAGYFCGPVHVARVQAWRAAHPGYARGQPRRAAPLQDSLIAQVPDMIEECPIRTESAGVPSGRALQDSLTAPSPVLAGLIAHLFEVTLQEDIAATILRLVQLGHDVMNRSGDADSQACATAGATAPGARAVQLG